MCAVKVARYSNGHKYPKHKQRTPNLTSFAQIGLAIMFTTNSCVKHRILHVLRDADAISHVNLTARKFKVLSKLKLNFLKTVSSHLKWKKFHFFDYKF